MTASIAMLLMALPVSTADEGQNQPSNICSLGLEDPQGILAELCAAAPTCDSAPCTERVESCGDDAADELEECLALGPDTCFTATTYTNLGPSEVLEQTTECIQSQLAPLGDRSHCSSGCAPWADGNPKISVTTRTKNGSMCLTAPAPLQEILELISPSPSAADETVNRAVACASHSTSLLWVAHNNCLGGGTPTVQFQGYVLCFGIDYSGAGSGTNGVTVIGFFPSVSETDHVATGCEYPEDPLTNGVTRGCTVQQAASARGTNWDTHYAAHTEGKDATGEHSSKTDSSVKSLLRGEAHAAAKGTVTWSICNTDRPCLPPPPPT